jgi:cytochrome c-type biogenesis protein
MTGFEVSYAAALGAGALSFLSPCVLPLVPAYVCYVAGTTLDRLTASEMVDPALARRVLWTSLAFVLGFSTVFVALGASASAINRLLFEHLDLIAKIAGAVIVLFGLQFMGLFRIGFLNREARFDTGASAPPGLLGAYIVGLAFAFGWTPCVGPILATILTLAASQDSVGYGTSLLATYAAGLGIPFVLAALGIRSFLEVMKRLRPHMRKIEFGAGLLLVATGVLVFTNSLQALSGYLLDWFPWLAVIG